MEDIRNREYGLTILLFWKISAMLLMLFAGYLLVVFRVLKSEQSTVLSSILLWIVAPCLTLAAMQQSFAMQKLFSLGIAFVVVILIHLIFIVLARFLAKKLGLNAVEQCCLVYSNGGNLIVPLVTALLGKDYVFYGIAFLVVQTVLNWTNLVKTIQPAYQIDIKQIVTNPNMIVIVLGLGLFQCKMQLPFVWKDVCDSFTALAGPISMVMIGMLMAQVDLKKALGSFRYYWICADRLIVFPARLSFFWQFFRSQRSFLLCMRFSS